MNIIEQIESQLDDRFTHAAANETGLSAEETRTTTRAAIPALLAGLMGSLSKPDGGKALGAELTNQNQFGNLSTMATGTGTPAGGMGALTSVLGEGRLSGIANAISGFSGVSQNQSRSLLGMLFPVVMGVLGREQRGGGMNVDGISRMLQSHKREIAEAMPASVASSLRSTGVLDDLDHDPRHAGTAAAGAHTTAGAAGAGTYAGSSTATGTSYAGTGTAPGTTARGTTGAAPHGTTGRPRSTTGATTGAPRRTARTQPPKDDRNWFWPIAAGIAAIALVVWGVTQMGDDEPDRPVTATTTVPAEPVQTTDPVATDDAVQVAALPPSDIDLRVGDVDLREQFTDAVDRATQSLRGVTDAQSAEAAMPTLNEVNNDLDGMLPLADRLPESARNALGSVARDGYDRLEPEIDRIESLPAVPDSAKQVVRELGDKVQSLFGLERG